MSLVESKRKERTRDAGLDAIRGMALAMMAIAHFSRFIPKTGGVADYIMRFCDTAPVFFFFAFGFTLIYALKKDHALNTTQNIIFLFIALIHTLYLSSPKDVTLLCFRFLLFLALARILLIVFLKTVRHGDVLIALLTVAGFCLAYQDPGRLSRELYAAVDGGSFVLFPWILVVTVGYLTWLVQNKGLPRSVMLLSGLALCLFAVWYAVHARKNVPKVLLTYFVKGEANYLLFYCGLNVVIYCVFNMAGQVTGLLLRCLPFIGVFSRNLLLGTVMHYIPIHHANLFVHAWWTKEQIAESPLRCLAVGGGLCLLELWVLVVAVAWVWKRIEEGRVLRYTRTRFALIAMVLFILLLNLKLITGSSSFPEWRPYIPWVKNTIMAFMIWSALEMRPWAAHAARYLRGEDRGLSDTTRS